MGVTKTVGDGTRDYQSIANALAFFSGYDHSTNGGGESYVDIYPEGAGTDGEWVITALLVASSTQGVNATSSNHLVIRAAPGYGFADHVNKETNALRYNPANGVAIRMTTNSTNVLELRTNHTHVRGLQFKTSATTPGSNIIFNSVSSGTPTQTISGCILASTNLSSGAAIRGFDSVSSTAGNFTIVNCLFQRTRLAIYTLADGSKSVHNTCWHDGNNSAQFIALAAGISANTLAYAGSTDDFTTPTSGSYSSAGIGSANCASGDGTGPPTNLVDADMVDCVESLTSGSEDFRLKDAAPSGVKTGGLDASSITSVDILGRSRPASGLGSPSIGCYEFYGSASGVPKSTKLMLLGVG